MGQLLQTEDERERVVQRAQLSTTESAGGSSQALRVDDRRLLNEHTGFLAEQFDHGPKCCRPRAPRRRRDQHRAKPEQLVSLHDDGIPRSLLLVPAGAARGRQPKNFAADHSALKRRRELGHLLADRTHLATISAVCCEPAYLIANRSATTAPSGGFTQRYANSLRVIEALGAHEIKRRDGVVIETYVQRTCHPDRL